MLISVVVPVYNRARLVERTLRSVKAQTHRPVELIIVDNGSTDDSQNICRQFAEAESSGDIQVKVLTELRKGASAARNCGLAVAQGEYISFFDSDDEMSPEFLSDAAEAFSENPAAQLAAGATKIVDDAISCEHRRVFLYTSDVRAQILTGQLSTQSFVVSKSFAQGIGGWDETLMRWNDWEFGLRIMLARPHIAWLRHRTYHRIHAHAESITGTGFSSSCAALSMALNAAARDLQISRAPRAAHSALVYRYYILRGLMRREHGGEQLSVSVRISPLQRIFGSLLCRYTALGGRGAWRMAMILSRIV